jgi:sulfite reductase (NADPH) flavoprotein alpha-component
MDNNNSRQNEKETYILFASQTGNAENLAHDLAHKINSPVLDMADVSSEDLKSFKNVIIITSTYGDGEHPDNGQILWDSVQDIDKLSCNYAILGLGDTIYDFFCKSAEDWDSFFSSLGANRKIETLKLDIDYEEQANDWIEVVKSEFSSKQEEEKEECKPSDNSGLSILFSSQTGNAENLAHDLASATSGTVYDMADISSEDLKSFKNVIIITSTYGEGEHPDNGQILWDSVQDMDKLSCDYAVLGLGDTAYDFFCKSAEDWDSFFSSLGANRKIETLKLDVDYEEQANDWIENIKTTFSYAQKKSSEPTIEKAQEITYKSIYTKNNPYMGELLKSELLSKKGSDKQVHHFEFEVKDGEMQYEAGDSIGVIPINSEALVNGVLSAGKFNGDIKIDGKKFSDILLNEKEIRLPNKNFISAVTTKSNDTKLKLLHENKKEMDKFIWGREIVDFLNDYNVSFSEQEFLELLNPLQHRLYSISSSPKTHSGEVHLTVATLKYKFNGRDCEGVASCFLADRLKKGDKVGLFMHPNKSFSIPQDNTAPMIMVGPGTGIAPFRGFIQERIERNATGENWLFFGDRTKNDYLYQEALEKWQEQGKVRLSLAWSRENNKQKTYVQNLMLKEGADLFNALEKGGYFFVCGDASKMAKDVDATLLEIVARFGAMSIEKATNYINELKKQKRYVRDVY